MNRISRLFISFATATFLILCGAQPGLAAQPMTLDLGDGVLMELVWIPPGAFNMGSIHGDSDEQPIHKVTIQKGFWIGKHEVTQRQYATIMGRNPSTFRSPDRPVENVSVSTDVRAFLKSVMVKRIVSPDYLARLPMEAEWEYVCRGGEDTDQPLDAGALDQVAWFASNSESTTHPVGQKAPNQFGVYDMQGNVWEWCEEWFHNFFYALPQAEQGKTGSSAGHSKVVRGGCWRNSPSYCRAANRFRFQPWRSDYTVGFRMVVQEK